MTQPAAIRITEAEFFDFIRLRDEKWELVAGEAVMMAGANQRHQTIAANVLASLHAQLRGKKCRPTASDTAVATAEGTLRYPDIVVDCGPRDDTSMRATLPAAVVEILSPSTRGFDSHRKVAEYKALRDIVHILLIDTEKTACLLHSRDGAGWQERAFGSLGDAVPLSALEASLSLADVYEGLDLKPTLVRGDGAPKIADE
jgi:Uma2 family endonuclease